MTVNFSRGIVKCFRTGYFAHLPVFVRDVTGMRYTEAKDLVGDFQPVYYRPSKTAEPHAQLPPSFMTLAYGDCSIAQRAREYLAGRGFDIDVLDSLGIGYCNSGPYIGSIIIPYKRHGRLVYWTSRSIIGGLRYKNPSTADFGIGKGELIYNEDALFSCDTVFLGEGAFDALTAGFSGIALGGWSLSPTQRKMLMLGTYSTLVVMPDRGFYKQAATTFNFILGHKTLHILNPELLAGKDANDWGYEGLMSLYDFSRPMRFSDILNIY